MKKLNLHALISRQHLCFWMLFLANATAFASGGGGGGDHHGAPHVQNWWGMSNPEAPAIGWMFVTFFTFVAILVAVARKPINRYLASRSDEIKEALEEAKLAKAAAEAREQEYRERIAKLDDEIDALKNDFRTRGQDEMNRLEEAGRKGAARIKRDAEETIQAEAARAQNALRDEASRLAIEIAESRIAKTMQNTDHSRLADSFLSDIAN